MAIKEKLVPLTLSEAQDLSRWGRVVVPKAKLFAKTKNTLFRVEWIDTNKYRPHRGLREKGRGERLLRKKKPEVWTEQVLHSKDIVGGYFSAGSNVVPPPKVIERVHEFSL
jgi:hypothetical protein